MILKRLRLLIVVLFAVLGLGVTTFIAGPAFARPTNSGAVSCTHTSSGSCIRGGEFCPQASYGATGIDAEGRRYVCSGDHEHPHWEVASSGGGGSSNPTYDGHVLTAGDGFAPDGRYKPRTTYLSGDGTLTMRKSQWTKWTPKTAIGHGVGYLNTCDPYCYNGRTVKLKMKVVESVPRNACGKRYYTHYRVTFARKPTRYTPKSYTLVRSITCG